ncbi:TorF family putative porin [Xanthomonadaceae bacterium JHOS43]|nr:TorF family putative porin [Xanthomonadaceae bacterium JHOS43]MCX7563673.1 TorF family putative porin [Xanthomonadaceae bacterium XH05]
MSPLSRLAAAAALAIAAAPVFAQDESPWSVSGGVWAVSDYVWRGVSQTQEDPTWQVELGVEHKSGFYAGAFVSGVDFIPSGADWDDGIDYEVNAYLGWSQQISDTLTLDLSYTRIAYPGAKADYDADFDEFTAELGIGDNYTATVVYSPDTVNLGSSAMYYRFGGEWELGDSGILLGAAAGLYDLGQELGGSYKDYELSLARSFGNVAVKLAYFDTAGYNDELAESLGDRHLADGRAMLSVGYEF